MKREIYDAYVNVLKMELVPAFGCTEPITIAYAAAKAKELLGDEPDHILIEASGNIIKNVKSVVVPNTDGLKGIEAAAAIGIVAGRPEKELEVISQVTQQQKAAAKRMLENKQMFEVHIGDSPLVFDFQITLKKNTDYVKIRIVNSHTNIVLMEKNGRIVLRRQFDTNNTIGEIPDERKLLNVQNIIEFADSVNPQDVKDILERQIQYNTAISEEGLNHDYGANVGKVLLREYDSTDVRVRARAKAAAGSDARMSGCEMPVIINSGSGNQGLTVSIPVIEFAQELGCSRELLYRALVLSNLIAIHQKKGIGTLSAYCGAVSAGCAAAAGIAYLYGGRFYEISHTIVNCLAITSGIVCDGAKPSCAGKIASSVDAGILGYLMIKDHQQFRSGDGIVKQGVEETIAMVGRLGKDGMKETDREILRIMVGE